MKFIAFFVSIFLLCPTVFAENNKIAHTDVSLISEASRVTVGDSFWIALRMQLDEHWHVYWQNPGDSGTPPQIRWHLQDGWEAGPIQWPVPKRIDLPPLAAYGYEGEVLLLTKIQTTTELQLPIPTEIEADVRWLACRVDCVPGSATLRHVVNLSTEKTVFDPGIKEKFDRTRSNFPKITSPWQMQVKATDKYFELQFRGQERVQQAQFFPDRSDAILHAAPQILSPNPDGFSLRLSRSTILQQNPKSLKGLLLTDQGNYMMEGKVVEEVVLSGGTASIWLICIFAFIGGLILNIMPCVLPVLTLKIMALAKHGHNRRESITHGLVFALGVLLSFLLLNGVLLFIKNTGTSIGWGFQFQSPIFVGSMAAIFFVLALNLFGLFEIGTRLTQLGGIAQSKHGLTASFLNGLLATLVATPCTAPFMGPAISFALTQSAVMSFVIFACLAIGMAFPTVLLSAFPALLRFLPKPGPWMNGLKRFMGVLMLASCAWLLWVLFLQLNVSSSDNKWESYSPAYIASLKQQQKDYFLDFTAAWCLTCQVNDKLVLQNKKVVEKFKKANIILIKADWTKYDPQITDALAKYGRNSIPLYVWYSARSGREEVLGETISVDGILKLLDKQ